MSAPTTISKRGGQVILLAPIMMIVLLAFLALTADVGQITVARSNLQNSADATALAALHVLVNERIDGVDEAEARADAAAEAALIKEANTPGAGLGIEFGVMGPSGDFTPVDTDTPATAVRAEAYRNADADAGQLPLIFAPIVGLHHADVAAEGIAEVGYSIGAVFAGLSPFAVPVGRIPGIGEEMIFYPAGPPGGSGHGAAGSGVWGLLNLNGGALGTPELVEWIVNGYDGGIVIDPDLDYVWIDGTTGFRATLESVLQGEIGNVHIVVVYDQLKGSGATSDFRCIGFIRVRITGADLTGKEPFVSAIVEGIVGLHDIAVGGGFVSPNIFKIRLIR